MILSERFKVESAPVSDEEALQSAAELEKALGEIMIGTRNPKMIPMQPMIALIQFVRDNISVKQRVAELEGQRDEMLKALEATRKDVERWEKIELLMFLGNVELNQADDGGYCILLDPVENIMSQSWTGNSPEEVVDSVSDTKGGM